MYGLILQSDLSSFQRDRSPASIPNISAPSFAVHLFLDPLKALSPMIAEFIASRISAVGLVTVSLLRSIEKFVVAMP